RRRHTRFSRDWSSDVCSSDLSNLVAYISSEAMDALERSEEFQRVIQVQNQGTAIETRVTSLDGVRLVEVWDVARFNTQHDFTDGFVPEGQDINWVIVYKGAVVAVTKINSIYMFAPGQHTAGDGYLYQNRMYHDMFVLSQKADGVVVSIKPDDSDDDSNDDGNDDGNGAD